MSEVIPFDKDNVPSGLGDFIGGVDGNDALSAGVTGGGFSVVSVRGSKWRVKHGGEETVLTDSDGEIMSSIRVVMLKASDHVSKNYYEGSYSEGVSDAPSCFSLDGLTPDPSVENPVHSDCQTCPYNQFGSRITDAGTKAKKCADSRRVAVVPEGDYANGDYGGPMLLRVPATSLRHLSDYAKGMRAKGFPYNTVVTRVSFDPEVSYPRLKFNAVRPVTQAEADEIVSLLGNEAYRDTLDNVLAQTEKTPAPPKPAVPDMLAFEEPEPPKEEEKAPIVAKEHKPKKAEKVQEKPKKAEPSPALDEDLEDILSKLDDLD
jgi:hypothetical protein